MPVPNAGLKAAGSAYVQQALRALEKALPMVGAESDLGQTIVKAITQLSKVAGPDSASPGTANAALQRMMMDQKQEQPMRQQMAAQAA